MNRAANRAANSAKRGFTLIEMVAVLAIVGVLAAAARPLLTLTARRSQEHQLRTALRDLRNAIDAYKLASDAHLIATTPGASGYPPNLRALVDGAALPAQPGKRRYFLRRLPRDPFADAQLSAEQSWHTRASDSPPERPTAGRDVFDVMSRSAATALDGSAYRDW